MFAYTRAAIYKTWNDICSFLYGFNVTTQAIYIAYLVIAMIVGVGILWANAVLATVSLISLVIFIVLHEKRDQSNKYIRRANVHITRTLRLTINAFTLGVSVYGIYIASEDVSFLTLLFALISLVMWLVGLVVEIVTYIIEDRIDYFTEAYELDIAELKKPVNAVGDFIKKSVGIETEPTPERKTTKHTKRLEKDLSEKRRNDLIKKAEKQAKKEEERRKKIHTFFGAASNIAAYQIRKRLLGDEVENIINNRENSEK